MDGRRAEILRNLLFYPKIFSENRQCNNCGGVGRPAARCAGGAGERERGSEGGEGSKRRERDAKPRTAPVARRRGAARSAAGGTGVMAVGRDVPIAPPG